MQGQIHSDSICAVGPRPRMHARLGLTMKMLRYASMRLAIGDANAWTCYVTPSYTGGASMAAVDGRLRHPQCFGSRGEPWAQTGAAHCITEMDQMPDVHEVTVPGRGYMLLVESWT